MIVVGTNWFDEPILKDRRIFQEFCGIVFKQNWWKGVHCCGIFAILVDIASFNEVDWEFKTKLEQTQNKLE